MTTPTETTPRPVAARSFICPSSGTAVVVCVPPRHTKDEFCPTCDFPMFWSEDVERATREVLAREAEQARLEREQAVITRERLARAAEEPPRAACPNAGCGLGNPAGARFCAHCGVLMLDAPAPAPKNDIWLLMLIVTVALVLLAVGVALWQDWL
ncbi:MAG: hypothetical protein AAF567_03650 [Actinomycetota bacterium]